MKKITRKLFASILALSLMATSLPVIDNMVLANEEITEITTVGKDLIKQIGQVDNPNGGSPSLLFLYCNDETGTAFTFCGHDVPSVLKFLLAAADTFDGYFSLSEVSMKLLSFSNAEIEERHFIGVGYDFKTYHVVNHGDITYTDEAGEAHTFTCMKDLENYVIQNYPVTLLDIDEIPEEDLPWVTTPTTEPVTTTTTTTTTTVTSSEPVTSEITMRKDLVTRIGSVENPDGGTPYGLYLYDNDETGTSFTFCGNDVATVLQFLIDVSDTFDYGMKFSLSANTKENLDFPDAEIFVRGAVGSGNEYYDIVNYGDIVYTDEAGEAHTFSCMKDIEDYLIQSNLVTLLSEASTTTEEPSNVPIGDVTLDGKVDLIDAICLSKICMNIISATDTQKLAGDCNADGDVTDADITLLMEFCIGLQNELPVTD